MKYIKFLTSLLVLGAGMLATSCSDNDDVTVPGGLAIDKEQIEIGAEGGSAEHGVGHGVQEHIGVRVAVKAEFKRNLHAAQNERTAFDQSMGVVSLTYAEGHHGAVS